jgi:hypothetical protein
LGGRRQRVDSETMEMQRELDEAFDNVVVLEPPPSPSPDDDWMPGEFDIT